jgi:hypothetical protein
MAQYLEILIIERFIEFDCLGVKKMAKIMELSSAKLAVKDFFVLFAKEYAFLLVNKFPTFSVHLIISPVAFVVLSITKQHFPSPMP